MKNNKWCIEVIKDDVKRGDFKSAIFDFDGTLSLIRQGWRNVMISYFTEVLKETPQAEDEDKIVSIVSDFVDYHTGEQTIYQCICLNEEIVKRGGKSVDPLIYKKEYHKRLMEKIKYRIDNLRDGKINPKSMLVPGSLEILKILSKYDINLYLASGTDECYVLNEAELLGITKFFKDRIFGAQDEHKLFSKALVIKNIIKTHMLKNNELLGFGDGYVEIENIKNAGGFAVGLATNEAERRGTNEWKRERLIKAGADIIIPDFRKAELIYNYLFNKGV